jgi:hypothetical protein
MLKPVALLAVALTLMGPAFADTAPTGPNKKPVVAHVVTPTLTPPKVVKKQPPACNVAPGHACPRH